MKLTQGRDGKWRIEDIKVNYNKKNESDLYYTNLAAVRKEWQRFDPSNEVSLFIDDEEIFDVLTNELGVDHYDKELKIYEDGEVVDTIKRHVITFILYPNQTNPKPLVMLRTSDKNQPIGMGSLAVADNTRLKRVDMKFHLYVNKNTGKHKPAIDEFWGTVDEDDDSDYFAKKYGYNPAEEADGEEATW